MKSGRKNNIPSYKTKLLLHLLSHVCLVINLVAFALILPDVRLWTIGIAALVATYTVVFVFDKRRHEWEWWSIAFGILLSVAFPICYILLFDLYFYFIVLGAEALISSLIFLFLRSELDKK